MTLNISSNGDGEFSLVKQKHLGIMIYTYGATLGQNVSRVIDGGYPIWNSNGGPNRVKNVVVYSYGSKHMLCYIIFFPSNDLTKFYKKKMNTWEELTPKEFEESLHKMKVERHLDVTGPFDESVFIIESKPSFGLPQVILTPLGDFRIVRIFEENSILLEDYDGAKRCTQVIINGPPGDPKLVQITVSIDSLVYQRYFVKSEQGWERVTIQEYRRTFLKIDREYIDKEKIESND